MAGAALSAGAIVVGGSTVWFSSDSPFNLAVAAAGIALLMAVRFGDKRVGAASSRE